MATAPEQPSAARTSPWRARWEHALTSCLQLATAFIIYVFSIGPMYWSWYRGVYCEGPQIAVRIYSPLYHLAGWCPPFGEWLNWYVQLWIDWG